MYDVEPMTTQRVIVLCAPTSRLDTTAAELFVVEPASRQRPVRAIGARLASRREGSVITTFSLAPSVGEVMSEHFFGRKVSEEKNEDGQFDHPRDRRASSRWRPKTKGPCPRIRHEGSRDGNGSGVDG